MKSNLFLARAGFELIDHRAAFFVPFESLRWLDTIVERPLSFLELSDLGILQFSRARKTVATHD